MERLDISTTKSTKLNPLASTYKGGELLKIRFIHIKHLNEKRGLIMEIEEELKRAGAEATNHRGNVAHDELLENNLWEEGGKRATSMWEIS
jgi:hypothetical protein